ncbi:cytochrome P450 [Streptomyces sp. KL116D]|uniref:cytochrome P450 n=1 Tax=Streptomyces sp. KL116D TaxID=3045152 RepID=UPI0035565F79
MTTPTDKPVFPYPRTCPYAPPEAYTRFREEGGLHKVDQWNGEQAWLATSYADVRAVLGDAESFSSDITMDGFPLSHAGQREHESNALMRKDDPEHAHDRRILTREFSVKRVEALRDRVREITDELIDDLLVRGKDGPVDLVEHFAHQIPARIICEMMGLSDADRVAFAEHILITTDYAASGEKKRQAHGEMNEMFDRVIAEKRADRKDDIVSRLVHEHLDTGDIDLDTAKTILLVLFAGGQDTTANMIGLSVQALLEFPEQIEQLHKDPAGSVEELLRFLTVNQGEPRRVVAQDAEVGGCPVKKGEGIIASLNAANFDSTVFDRDNSPAGDLDLTRAARNHVAFGFGGHQCLGQNLARVELQVALPQLFERIPGLRLARPVAPDDYRTTAVIYGLEHLYVTW